MTAHIKQKLKGLSQKEAAMKQKICYININNFFIY